jgi:hypothetical protein
MYGIEAESSRSRSFDLTRFEAPADAAEIAERRDRLLKLVETADMPASVRAAYQPETVTLFDSGMPATDARYHQGSLELRAINIADYQKRVTDIYTLGSFSPDLKGITAEDREVLRTPAPALRQSIQQAQMVQERGLQSCPGVTVVLSTIQFLYYPVAEPVWEMEKHPVKLPEADLRTLYGADIPESLSLADITERVHSDRELDFSQEMLDKRFETFVGLINLDLSRMTLLGLSELHAVRGATSNEFIQFAQQHKDVILSDDLLSKHKLLYELGKRYSRHPRGGTQLQKRASAIQGVIFNTLAHNSEEFLQYFKNVYINLGYELPSLLQQEEVPVEEAPPTPVVAQIAANTVVRQLAVVEEPIIEEVEPAIAPEIVNAIEVQKTEISGLVEESDKPWRLSRKKLKELQLDKLRGQLCEGAHAEAQLEGMGDWDPLAPMTADQTAMLLGTLVRIEEVGQKRGRGAVGQLLEQATKTHHELIDTIDMLISRANDEGYATFIRPNRPYDPLNGLQYVADNWHIFSQLLLNMAPENFAGNVWQYLPEPREHSRYAALLREYHWYNHNTVSLPADS